MLINNSYLFTQDTIRLLRTALTKTAAAGSSELTPTADTESSTAALTTPTLSEPAQSYERRAINFLVHEYLLGEDYRPVLFEIKLMNCTVVVTEKQMDTVMVATCRIAMELGSISYIFQVAQM